MGQIETTRKSAARKTIADLRFYFPVIAVQGVMGLVCAALATKLFPPEDYGRYVLAFAVYSQLTLITSLWLQFSIIRFAPYYRAKGLFDEFASTVFFTEVLFICFLGLVLPFLAPVVSGSSDGRLTFLLTVAAIAALIIPFVAAVEQFYRIDDRPKAYSFMVLFRILCGPALGIFLARPMRLGMAGFFSGIVAPQLVLCLVLLIAKRRRVKSLFARRSISPAILKELLLYSAPGVALATLASSLVLSDRYLLAWYTGAYALAVYSIAYTIGNQGVELITTVLIGAADPIAMRLWEEQGAAKAHPYIGQILRYYSILAIPAVVALAVLGRQLIPILATGAYEEGWPVIGYVALGVLFCGYAQILSRLFFFEKRTTTPLLLFGIAAAANILINVLLLPHFGYIAAAWSKVAAYLLLLVMVSLAAGASASIGFGFRPCLRMAGSALFMGILIYTIRDAFASVWLNLALCLPVGAASYFLGLVLTGEIKIKHAGGTLQNLTSLLKT